MSTITLNGNEAVLQWEQVINLARSNKEVVIECDQQPVAVLVNAEWLEELKRKAALSDSPSVIAERNTRNGTWVSQEEIDKKFAHVLNPV